MAGPLILLGLWMLVAGQGEASTVHIHLDDRELLAQTTREQTGSTYIVHVRKSFAHGSMDTLETAHSRYTQLLQSIKPSEWNGGSAKAPLHVYSSVCHGFSASLTSQEAEALRKLDGVLGVYPDTIRSLHTTRTPDFLKLNSLKGLLPAGHFGDDVIVGVLDTGVWPERESFSDEGLGSVPARWKGICQAGEDFKASNCNRKLIGARYFVAGYEAWLLNTTGKPFNETLESKSPRDTDGHGTHTSSTAAGSPVPDANLFGLANGTARGMAPKARIAMYKVCWAPGCFDSDILAAFDQAVADGVDVISLSLGGTVVPYNEDSIAIGAFGAMEKGVFVSASAGNSGPELATVANVAPWIMTIAASTLDRTFLANVVLGNGRIVPGVSLYVGKGLKNATEMITGANASLGNVTESTLCISGSLNPALVAGKIVVCERGDNARVEKGAAVLAAGGAGMILTNTATDAGILADPHVLPALMVEYQDGTTVLDYMNSTKNPIGNFQFLGTRLNVKPAPVVAGFSSRGPNLLTLQVPKPDITAPGENIIAAWTGAASPTDLDFDTRRVNFNIISGTSMSAPHVSGIGALLKGAYPHWSPAAIKSAMMTTATIHDNTGGFITDESGNTKASPFQYGSGEVQPQQALDPGLVYDMGFQDYVNFLCASNYSEKEIQIFTSTHNETVSCPQSPVRLEDLNYPSFAAVFQQPPSLEPISLTMTRTVTHVGYTNTTYTAQITQPAGTEIIVDPLVLSFSAIDRRKTFTLQVTTVNLPSTTLSNVAVTDFGYLMWIDNTHVVQSPISITVYK